MILHCFIYGFYCFLNRCVKVCVVGAGLYGFVYGFVHGFSCFCLLFVLLFFRVFGRSNGFCYLVFIVFLGFVWLLIYLYFYYCVVKVCIALLRFLLRVCLAFVWSSRESCLLLSFVFGFMCFISFCYGFLKGGSKGFY